MALERMELFDKVFVSDNEEWILPEYCAFHGVTFLTDFGPWKAGEIVRCLCYSLDNCCLTEFLDNGLQEEIEDNERVMVQVRAKFEQKAEVLAQ